MKLVLAALIGFSFVGQFAKSNECEISFRNTSQGEITYVNPFQVAFGPGRDKDNKFMYFFKGSQQAEIKSVYVPNMTLDQIRASVDIAKITSKMLFLGRNVSQFQSKHNIGAASENIEEVCFAAQPAPGFQSAPNASNNAQLDPAPFDLTSQQSQQ